jgi:diguanylate cyclase (GGDEF)-like protein/PAS domain S-box-containing protein
MLGAARFPPREASLFLHHDSAKGFPAPDARTGPEDGRYQALFEQVSCGVILIGPDGRILVSNPAALRLLGHAPEADVACRIVDLCHPEDVERESLDLDALASGMAARVVCRMKRIAEDPWFWAELSASRLPDGGAQVIVRDITSEREAASRIRNLAYFDALTGLPNRELFREQIDKAIERCRRVDRPMALLFLDIDRFKMVNDSLGHSSGDVLLTEVADRLRSAVRGGDSIGRLTQGAAARPRDVGGISRLGGDEFTVVVADLEHPQDAARVARRILHALSRPFQVGGQEIFIGCSIGIAVWPDDGANSELLLRSADVAMYHAKGRGGGAYAFFNASMNVTSTRRLALESQLRRGLEREEFHLVYQPIRDTQTGRVSAVEALVRWTDASGQPVSPAEFIPIAEEAGLIVDLGDWVLGTACRQARAWQDQGFAPIRMSVNISVHQLRRSGIVDSIDQILFESRLEAGRLELEITESSMLDANPNIAAAISRLREMGVGFALDDFGTGYSSLSSLQRFPIERLKIDRSFVSGVGDKASDEALVSAIVALANRLSIEVVAEGVETQEQARFLTRLGCRELQGYLFSRPLAAADVAGQLPRDPKPLASAESLDEEV